LVSDQDCATVATKNWDLVPLKETTDAAFPVATSVPQLRRNLRQRVQLRHHFGRLLQIYRASARG
jgi:hypothetical protein